jgi:hypothetical protein
MSNAAAHGALDTMWVLAHLVFLKKIEPREPAHHELFIQAFDEIPKLNTQH